MNDISFSRVETLFSDVFSFLTDPSNPSHPLPLASSHFYRINEFSGCAPVFPGKRRRRGRERERERNGCCSATKAVIARTFVLLSEGCRRRRDTGASPCLASPRLAYRRRRSHKSGPTVFPGGSNAYRVFRVSRSRMGMGEKVEEARGEERRRKKGRGKKMEAKKSVLGAAKALCTRTRLIVPEERIFLERFRAVAKEIHR